MRRKALLLIVLSLLSIPMALADLMDTFSNVFDKIIGIGSLHWLGLPNDYILLGTTRLLIWVLCFTIFFGVISAIGKDGKALGFLNKNQGMVVAFVVATIAAIFIPGEVLLATGSSWATAIALLLIGLPIIGIGYALTLIPDDECHFKFLKFILCFILLWILMVMKNHLGGLV